MNKKNYKFSYIYIQLNENNATNSICDEYLDDDDIYAAVDDIAAQCNVVEMRDN